MNEKQIKFKQRAYSGARKTAKETAFPILIKQRIENYQLTELLYSQINDACNPI